MASQDAHLQALQALLPTGFAWPRDSNSTLMRLLLGLAGSLAELDALIDQAGVEWLPQDTATRMDEWESSVGLPDRCVLADATLDERRSAVMLRLRGIPRPYPDSSPAAPGAIAAAIAVYGYQAEVRYNAPFRCGRDRCGRRLGRLDGRLWILLVGQSEPFRCGRDRVGTRLYKRPRSAYALACYIQDKLPARFRLMAQFQEV